MIHLKPSLPFAAAAGLVAGRDHARAHRNAQDACKVHISSRGVVAVVADGCSSGASTEVGATLAATWIARHALDIAPSEMDVAARANAISDALVGYLRSVARGVCGGDAIAPDLVQDLFLFTLLVAIVTGDRALIFGAGDGLFAVNGVETHLDPGPENAPDYVGYALLDRTDARGRIRVHHVSGTPDLESLAIATDGALDLGRRAGEPLDDVAHAGLAQFTGDPRYARNPSLLRKRLTVIGAHQGRLHDDTAIAIIVRSAS